MNKNSEILSRLTPEAIALLNEIAANLNVQSPANIKQIKISKWIEKDIKLNKSNLSPSSLRSIRTSFKYFSEFFGDIYLHEIDKEMVAEFRSFLFSKVENLVYWRTIRASLNRAIELKYLKINYFNILKPPKKQKNKPAIISREEINSLKKFLRPKIFDIVVFVSLTGLRLGEVVNLKWNYVDLTESSITIGSSNFMTKVKKVRIVPLSEKAKRILRKYIPKVYSVDGNNFVFCKDDGMQFSSDYVSKSFKRACRKAGLNEQLHFHSLRISFGSELVRKGVSLFQVQQILGHSNPSTTQRYYAFLNIEALRDAVSKLDNPVFDVKQNEG